MEGSTKPPGLPHRLAGLPGVLLGGHRGQRRPGSSTIEWCQMCDIRGKAGKSTRRAPPKPMARNGLPEPPRRSARNLDEPIRASGARLPERRVWSALFFRVGVGRDQGMAARERKDFRLRRTRDWTHGQSFVGRRH